MKRVWLAAIPAQGSQVQLSEAEHHHLAQVRRAETASELEVLDGRGGLARARVLECSRKRTLLEILDHKNEMRESPLQLHIGLALPHQKSTLEDVLPGLVQLGVHAVHLIHSNYSGRIKGPEAKFLDRLGNISLQALKQSGRLLLPAIHPPQTFENVARTLLNCTEFGILFHPRASPTPAAGSGVSTTPSLAMLIGPEGGFTEAERDEAVALGWRSLPLGPRIQRMETAVIGACFWAQARYGDFEALRDL